MTHHQAALNGLLQSVIASHVDAEKMWRPSHSRNDTKKLFVLILDDIVLIPVYYNKEPITSFLGHSQWAVEVRSPPFSPR